MVISPSDNRSWDSYLCFSSQLSPSQALFI
jgi:hypothetical protein